MHHHGSNGITRASGGSYAGASTSSLPHGYRANSDDSGGSGDLSVKRDFDDLDGGEIDEDADGPPKKALKRGAKACTAVKMRCIASDPPEVKCRRCAVGSYECVFIESQRGRHKTRTSDIMAAKLKQMQATLDTVLHTIGGAPIPAPPQFALDIQSLSHSPEMDLPSRSRQSSAAQHPHLLDTSTSEHERYPPTSNGGEHSGHGDEDPFAALGLLTASPETSHSTSGLAVAQVAKEVKLRAEFPLRTPQPEPKTAPALLLEKIVTVEEVTALFEIFFDFCSPQAPFLDRALHTPTYTALYAPFLFTCICTVASRYLPNRPGLYQQCRATAIRLAAENVFSGSTSISIVQGCLILAHWNQPGFPNEGDRCYLFAGLAVRMSLELGLHVKTDVQMPAGEPEELRSMYEKDARNRERVWIHCVVTDRSLQMGKPPCISKEDYIIRNCTAWSLHPLAIGTDVGICSIAELHKIITMAVDAFYSDANSYTGANEHLDYPSVIRVFLSQTEHWRSTTYSLTEKNVTAGDAEFRMAMMNHYFHYYRVFVLSFAIQHAHDKPTLARDLAFYVVKGYESAVSLITLVKGKLSVTGRFRYGMDSTFVYLIQPTFASLVDSATALSLARDTATVLENAAVDESHTPAVYAAFLRSLIDSKMSGDRTAAVTRAGSRAGTPGAESSRLLPDLTASLQDILDQHATEDATMGLNATGDALNDNGFWNNHFAMPTAPIPAHLVRAGTSDAASDAGCLLSQNGAPRPTLGQLPPELKAYIVACVAEIAEPGDCYNQDLEDRMARIDMRAGHRQRAEARGRLVEGKRIKSTLWGVALLDRAFSGLVQPYLWKDIELMDATLPDIGTFLLDFAPRHGRHVERLALQLRGGVGWDPLSEELSPGLAARWGALDVFPEEEEESRLLRFRRELLAELVPLLPNLARVAVDYFVADERDTVPTYLQQKEIADALVKIGSQITSLVIDNDASDEDAEPETSEGHLATFLEAFPNLTTLMLMIPLLPSGRSHLQSTITSLASLRTIKIEMGPFVNEDFSNLPWTAPLDTLSLIGCADISLKSLFRLVTNLSGSLETLILDIDCFTEAEPDAFLYPLHLPKLHHLTLGTIIPVEILHLFSKVSLQVLTIDSCPGIKYGSWLRFIIAQSSIKTVELLREHDFTGPELHDFGNFCRSRNIKSFLQDPIAEGDFD
ncbi:hypothetical protein RQP46_003656 [Phenoliferia psychrophenolica]